MKVPWWENDVLCYYEQQQQQQQQQQQETLGLFARPQCVLRDSIPRNS